MAGRSSYPTPWIRIVSAPISDATFWVQPARSTVSRYSDSRVQVTSTSCCCASSSREERAAGGIGPIDSPSPKIWVVTPWTSSPSDVPSSSTE